MIDLVLNGKMYYKTLYHGDMNVLAHPSVILKYKTRLFNILLTLWSCEFDE